LILDVFFRDRKLILDGQTRFLTESRTIGDRRKFCKR